MDWFVPPLWTLALIKMAKMAKDRPIARDGSLAQNKESFTLGNTVAQIHENTIKFETKTSFSSKEVGDLVKRVLQDFANRPAAGLKDGNNEQDHGPDNGNNEQDHISEGRGASAKRGREEDGGSPRPNTAPRRSGTGSNGVGGSIAGGGSGAVSLNGEGVSIGQAPVWANGGSSAGTGKGKRRRATGEDANEGESDEADTDRKKKTARSSGAVSLNGERGCVSCMDLRDHVLEKCDNVLEVCANMNKKLQYMAKRLESMNARLETMDTRVAHLETGQQTQIQNEIDHGLAEARRSGQ